MSTTPRVLVVDDEAAIRFALGSFLQNSGYDVEEAESCASALETFRKNPPHAVVLDMYLGDGSALDLMPRFFALDSLIPIVVVTAHGSIEHAVEAIKAGATQYLTKPVALPALETLLRRCLEDSSHRRRGAAEEVRRERAAPDPFKGSSMAMLTLERDATRVARSDSPVLVLGETGAGKGVLARWIHDHSARSNEAFVDLNCAGFSKEFLESELFGYERGAFTGAVNSKPGLLELAHRGTLFLDEIGELDPSIQPKLLKVLEDQRFRRLGSVKERQVDVRIMAATHRDVLKQVREEQFRADLFYRLSVISLSVPALRERREDLGEIVDDAFRQLASSCGRGALELSASARSALEEHAWPGNIRELRNVLERALLFARGPLINAADLRFDTFSEVSDDPESLEALSRLHIERTLAKYGQNVAATARALGISRSTLYERLQKLEIPYGKERSRDSSGPGV